MMLHLGDCLDVMRGFDDGCMDLTVTSPPHDNLRTYNGSLTDWTEVSAAARASMIRSRRGEGDALSSQSGKTRVSIISPRFSAASMIRFRTLRCSSLNPRDCTDVQSAHSAIIASAARMASAQRANTPPL